MKHVNWRKIQIWKNIERPLLLKFPYCIYLSCDIPVPSGDTLAHNFIIKSFYKKEINIFGVLVLFFGILVCMKMDKDVNCPHRVYSKNQEKTKSM